MKEVKEAKYSVDAIINQVDKIKRGEVTDYVPKLYYRSRETADRICAKLLENGIDCEVAKSDVLGFEIMFNNL